MNLTRAWVGAALAAVLLAGCKPEARLFWSPDGTRAAVRLPQGLCLVDTNGVRSAPLAQDVTSAAWLADGKGLVLVRGITVTNWTEVERLVSPAETAPARLLAPALPGLLKGARAVSGGDIDSDRLSVFEPLMPKNETALLQAALCMRDTRRDELASALKGAPGGDKVLNDLTGATVTVSEVSLLRLAGPAPAGERVVLTRTLLPVGQARPSPSAAAVAFDRERALVVAPLDGGTNRVTVAERIAGEFDWTPDGRSLVYAVPLAGEEDDSSMNLARLERRTALDAHGAPIAGEVVPLALVCFASRPCLRCLPDGRVLLAGLAMSLPAAATSAQEARLYLLDGSKPGTAPVSIATAPDALPKELAYFAPSPDGRRIAVVQSGDDAVSVVTIADGRVEAISPPRGARCRTLPAWRGADELFYAALAEAGAKRVDLWRWRPGAAPERFCRTWTDDAVKGLLEMPK